MQEESVLIIAGEMSGEEIALGFIDEIQEKYPHLQFFGVGGDRLKSKGVKLLYHLKNFSSWGISGVISKIPFYFKALDKILSESRRRSTKIAILIDFQTFNFKLAKKLHKDGVKVLFLVAPQAWAWKAWRGREMAKWTEALFCLIPFEKKWFSDRGVKQTFHLTHPMYSQYENVLAKKEWKDFKQIKENCRLLLLPGSRKFEVKNLLPIFLQACEKLKEQGLNIEVGVLQSSTLDQSFINPLLQTTKYSPRIFHEGEEAFLWADLGLACSGTITLTSALFEIPSIVCYRTSLLNQFVFETFVSYTGPISLANIMKSNSIDKDCEKIFPELVQDEVSLYNILHELRKLLEDQDHYDKIRMKLSGFADNLRGEQMTITSYFTKFFEGK